MPIEITITVKHTDESGAALVSRGYALDQLLALPQGHVQLWNDLMIAIDDAQKMPHSPEEEIENMES